MPINDKNIIEVEKNLVCLDDLLLGKKEVEQQRGQVKMLVKGINIPFIIDKAKNINSVDIDKFQLCICLGLDDVNDGKGGIFYYDKDCILDADNINIFIPDLGIGRWIKLKMS